MEKKILNIIKEIFELEEAHTEISQSNCVKWDSLNHLNLILEIEAEFNISFNPEEIGNIKSVNDILNILKEKI